MARFIDSDNNHRSFEMSENNMRLDENVQDSLSSNKVNINPTCSTLSPTSASDLKNQDSPSNQELLSSVYETCEGNNRSLEPISDDGSYGKACKRKRCDSSSNSSPISVNIYQDVPTTLGKNTCPFVKRSSSSTSAEHSAGDITTVDLNHTSTLMESPNHIEFDVLDDLEESDGEDVDAQESNFSDPGTDDEDGLPVEDIDEMLEEGLPEKFKDSSKGEGVVKVKRKVVLDEIGHNHFELLPEDWIQIMHNSGMPLYLHKKTRVCTMSRPYFLGPGSSRNHKIPLSAIPCLQYKKALDDELKKKQEDEKQQENTNQPDIQLLGAKIETSEENYAYQSLEASELREYCEKVFKFKTVSIMPFKTWAVRRKYVRTIKDFKRKQRPTLPSDTKLLKIPVHNPGESSREWIINPNGKSYVCILHEYVQHALKTHPKYEFKELANPTTPYSATVMINSMQYGMGLGASKKQAKNEAAKAALEVLIPEIKDTIGKDGNFDASSGSAKTSEHSSFSIFDEIKIEDPRVAEFCAKTTEPPPYAILLTCLSRNMGLGDIQVHYEMSSKKNKEDEFTMTVGNHKAVVLCKNKREGKQRAAQAILQALHPNLKHWGSLLRMYGNKSVKSVKEKKQEEQQITSLQSKAAPNQPNNAILNKLKEEMLKLKAKRDSIKAKGKFIPPDNILTSLSSTDLCKVNFNTQ